MKAKLKKNRKIVGCGGTRPKPVKQENKAQIYLC